MGEIPDVASALANYVRALRRRADASQREMALRSGVPLSTIIGVESGRVTNVRLDTLVRLAEVGDCRLALIDDAATVVGPHDERARDLGGRRFPAHLDVRVWVPVYDAVVEGHGPHTFDRVRRRRDERRVHSRRKPIPLKLRLRIERLEHEVIPIRTGRETRGVSDPDGYLWKVASSS